ncbi:type II restriction endonuclease subunit M [Veillonellaceae bacterium M2-8]|nr:type II restriction endonuclease subunit M [Veillonellaceae bacterium M2-8]
MITVGNLKALLIKLGYKQIGQQYVYNFESKCKIVVDFENEQILYPVEQGLVVNERQTCNFSDNENFVVLECVHRLLEKGYNPQHIELERRWPLGHLQKSGRADICVMNATGNDLLFIVECKTYGNEFDNALKDLKNDGGQLFSYYQQERSAKWLMLYASDIDNDEVLHQVNTVPVFDTEEVMLKAKKDKSIKLFESANSTEQAFEVWKETYQQKLYDDLIFSDDTISYNIGEKPLRKKDLKEFNPNDKIVNRFEEILRHNNVSDKENAFNKLTALFICKLVDEITKDENDIVEFQYKYGTDTYETMLDRLQRLYKEGMNKFMKEDIFYVSSEYPSNLFASYKGQNRKNAIADLKETFRKLKFYSNSDFAFKDVHNEELFRQNGKILVEVVKLFEKYKIVYSSRHQFLGDLFEQLLNQGFKQNEGQFFTPIPITRFIWESLSVKQLSENLQGDKHPKVIDYSCGSGHFLTEGIETINALIKGDNNDWVSEKIYGIEKDYRLARVSKISLFMNGAGGGNIIFGDGLDNHKDKGITDKSFDVLVANPPYSVKAFKAHLKLQNNDFELLDCISNDGGEIEVLFVERIAQLLKPNGIAAVILPSSILSNSSESYMCARNVLLKNFKIISIAQLGAKTFGATGTNTVVIFLQKYNEPPTFFKMVEDNVQAVFNDEKVDDWKDNEVIDEYLNHIGVDKDMYIDFIAEKSNYDDFEDDEYFKMYVDTFRRSIEFKNILSRTSFNNLNKDEQQQKLNAMFYTFAKSVEMEKLFYFSLVKDQETLVIKAPDKNAEQTEFLGYSWSNRKGNEGIQIKNEGGVMYDPKDRDSDERIAPLVRKAFCNELIGINEEMGKYASVLQTKNMLDFEREKFDKVMSLVVKENIEIVSKYAIYKLKEFCSVKSGNSAPDLIDFKDGSIPFFRVSDLAKYRYNSNLIETKDKVNLNKKGLTLFKKGTILFPKSGQAIYKNHRAIMGIDGYVVSHLAAIYVNDEKKLRTRYLYELLKQIDAKNLKVSSGYASLNIGDIENIKIPVPPILVQEKIIAECETLEKQYETTRMKIEDYKAKIQQIFEELEVIKSDGGGYRLSDLKIIFNPSKSEIKDIEDIDVSFIPMESLSEDGRILHREIRNINELKNGSYKYFKENDVLIAKITPCMENGKCAIATNLKNGIGFGSSEYHVFRCDSKIIIPMILFGFLNREKIRIDASKVMTGASGHRRVPIDFYKNLKINLPSREEQENIMERVYDIDAKIKELEQNQINLNEEISKVLKRELN